MTEPAEGWIRHTGRRCGELRLEHLAKALAPTPVSKPTTIY
jgi:hypothetical protein